MGKGHGQKWRRAAEQGHAVQCPYCLKPCGTRLELNVHIRDECERLEDDFIPKARLRTITQAQLNADPRYAPLLEVCPATRSLSNALI